MMMKQNCALSNWSPQISSYRSIFDVTGIFGANHCEIDHLEVLKVFWHGHKMCSMQILDFYVCDLEIWLEVTVGIAKAMSN